MHAAAWPCHFRPAIERGERGERVAGPQGYGVDTTLTLLGQSVSSHKATRSLYLVKAAFGPSSF
jgi:hypothetical protein